MTKFETIGVQHQDDSCCKQDAIKQFSWSCHCCCVRGMKLDCDRCAIAAAHENTIAAFESEERSKKNNKHKKNVTAIQHSK